jgi:23S rRNA (uracil1939-C5)-methyltransferase
MALAPGQIVELQIEKPAAGGRMIARHEGQVVLVLGAIPGERVRTRVEKVDKRLAFASTEDVLEPSADRLDPGFDILCGGSLYAHVAYRRQLTLKSEVIADAFGRLGKIPLEATVAVAPSPQEGYRMRARLHVRDGRPGFYREGTHLLCDAAATRQLLPETLTAVNSAMGEAAAAGGDVLAAEVTENMAGDQRGILLELFGGGYLAAGDPVVADPLHILTDGRVAEGEVRRRPASFFQGNRYLLPRLVTTVLDAVPSEGEVLDLYAGVGLFAAALAGAGRRGIMAVEGDRAAGADLEANAEAFGGALSVELGPVEEHLARRSGPPVGTIVVDPPRTGISRSAMNAIAKHGARCIVYVSCDPATMARDARRLLDAGYRLLSLDGFDLFPNTPHVETVGVFARDDRVCAPKDPGSTSDVSRATTSARARPPGRRRTAG